MTRQMEVVGSVANSQHGRNRLVGGVTGMKRAWHTDGLLGHGNSHDNCRVNYEVLQLLQMKESFGHDNYYKKK